MSYIYRQHGRDSTGIPIWSCRREDSGIVGFGLSMELARADFETKDATLLPYPDVTRSEEAIDDALYQGACRNE